MQIKVLLNMVTQYKSFVFESVELAKDGKTLEVHVRARKNSRPICSGCGKAGPGYDKRGERRFAFVPLWGLAVFLLYTMRRVDCPSCGPTMERVPWAEGKSRITKEYSVFLASWAKRLSWLEVSRVFNVSWYYVFESVDYVVSWGRENLDLRGVLSLGIDEIQWGRGHDYVTLVYQIDHGARRLLYVAPGRTVKSLLSFFRWFGKEQGQALQFVCSDMWKPYLKVIAKKASQAVHVLDRFHVASHMNKAVDEVRAKEARKIAREGGEAVLTKSRWCILKRPENLTERQADRLDKLLDYNLDTVQAYLLKEDFGFFWEYKKPGWAGKFLDQWCGDAVESGIEPMMKVAGMLQRHKKTLLNWFRAKGAISNGIAEGFNNKAKVITRRSYGFGTFYALQTALYHGLGNLPEPPTTHRFV